MVMLGQVGGRRLVPAFHIPNLRLALATSIAAHMVHRFSLAHRMRWSTISRWYLAKKRLSGSPIHGLLRLFPLV